MPLLHGRLTKQAYQFLIDKAARRLSGWKRKTLSKASRAVLIRSTLAALPVYAMQSAIIPKGIVAQLDQLCRGFFLGHSDTHRGLYTVAWAKLCTPISLGGLDFPVLPRLNLSLLCKTIWNLLARPEKLSSWVLVSKYGGWQSLIYGKHVASPSRLWRDLLQAMTVFVTGLRWRIGNGLRAFFWLDIWLGEAPLISEAVRPIDPSLRLVTVSYF